MLRESACSERLRAQREYVSKECTLTDKRRSVTGAGAAGAAAGGAWERRSMARARRCAGESTPRIVIGSSTCPGRGLLAGHSRRAAQVRTPAFGVAVVEEGERDVLEGGHTRHEVEGLRPRPAPA